MHVGGQQGVETAIRGSRFEFVFASRGPASAGLVACTEYLSELLLSRSPEAGGGGAETRSPGEFPIAIRLNLAVEELQRQPEREGGGRHRDSGNGGWFVCCGEKGADPQNPRCSSALLQMQLLNDGGKNEQALEVPRVASSSPVPMVCPVVGYVPSSWMHRRPESNELLEQVELG